MKGGLIFLLLVAAVANAEDIQLTSCDSLPTVQVSISGRKFSFLLDTAATSMLNLQSFPTGNAQKIAVTSWNGTHDAKGEKVTLTDFVIGDHHFRNLTLSAVDLSRIGHVCGHAVDGILGIDLLRRLGAVVDLKHHLARLPLDAESAPSLAAELDERFETCGQAFNTEDEQVLSDCLDPHVVLFTAAGDFHNREEVIAYVRQQRGKRNPPPQLAIIQLVHHVLGEEIWTELELRIRLGAHILRMRGTALCQKSNTGWRILHLNFSGPLDVLAVAGPRSQPDSQP